jgi:hypothetical protein
MMFSVIVPNHESGIEILRMFCMIMNFGAGMTVNVGQGASPVVRAISYISPNRYSGEMVLRTLLAGKEGEQLILNYYGYDWGYKRCMIGILVIFSVYYILGWIAMCCRAKQI